MLLKMGKTKKIPIRIVMFRTLLIIWLLLTVYHEYLIYVIKQFTTWPEVTCNSTRKCIKLLLVADPQILGELNENAVSRFDCDRYLRNSFSVAFDYVQPDGVIFLGDLEDEGTLADDEQYDRYYKRFQTIFQLQDIIKSNIPVVFIPGDNDIGGENNEIIKASNVKRFRKYFDKDDVAIIGNVQISKVNKLLRTYPSLEEKPLVKHKINIAVSHIPLTNVISSFTRQVIEDTKPEFIFSAHEHKSYALSTLKENGQQLYYEELKYNAYRNGISTWNFQTANSTNYTIITEIVVPTCSYRMGVPDMGYGVIVYDEDLSEIIYHVLWLPSRFASLDVYFKFFVICVIFLWLNFCYLRRIYGKRNMC